jgi:hypothetical protein
MTPTCTRASLLAADALLKFTAFRTTLRESLRLIMYQQIVGLLIVGCFLEADFAFH